MMAKHHEKVTISEPAVLSTWVGRPNFRRCIYHRVLEGRALPFLNVVPRAKYIPLGVQFSGISLINRDEEEKKNNAKSKSLECSPERDISTSGRVSTDVPSSAKSPAKDSRKLKSADGLPRVKSLEKQPASKLKKISVDIKKSASWSQFVESSQHGATLLEMEVPEQWVCDMSSLFLGHKFASGNHSRLYHGVYKDQDVAVKLLRLDECGEAAARLERQFAQEIYCLSQLQHPNIVQFVAASCKPPVCCTIMEYVPGGTLRAFLHKNELGSIPLNTSLSMALDVARGMEYLHSQGVVHRDLKSENLVITEDQHVKLTDFGVGCLETECDLRSADSGTYRWMAPEMIKHKHNSKKVDVYSFGIVLWELVSGLLPFEDMTPVQVAYAVVHKNARPTIPSHSPPALRRLMQQCWVANPEKRPNFYQIVKSLEDFEKSLTSPDISFTQAWHSPAERTNMFMRCFPVLKPDFSYH